MVILFIVIGDFVIQCFGNNHCAMISTTMFRSILAAGAVEILFEITGLIKIYRRKGSNNERDES